MADNLDGQLEKYADAFDFYIEQGALPESCEGDVLGDYLKKVLDEPGNQHLCRNDPAWREVFKNSVLEFFGHLLPLFNAIDRQEQEEQQYADAFFHAPIDKKRKMWNGVMGHISQTYPPNQVNMKGYLYLFQQTDKDKEDVFQALEQDWRKAARERAGQLKRKELEKRQRKFETWATEAGRQDYEIVSETASVLYKYPALQEILHLMGREKEENKEEQDETIKKYIPLLLSHHSSSEEINGVRNGDDLSLVLPAEIALLAEKDTEWLFYRKYVSKQLQLFSNRPPVQKREKTEVQRRQRPRLVEGPIIVCVDTSASMHGKPEKVAKSLLIQLLQVAKRKKRKCFLITYAVHSKTLELSAPCRWREVKEFLMKRFTGGTDGEMMFGDVLKTLGTETYSMADVLVISDFYFPEPCPDTAKKIKAEQGKGTRFYGLRVFNTSKNYDKWFDRIWQLR